MEEKHETEETPFLYEGLKEELSAEREKISSVTGHLSLLADRIKDNLDVLQKEFLNAQVKLEEQIKEGIQSASEDLAKKAFTIFKDKALLETNKTMSNLENIANRTYSNMSGLTNTYKTSFKKLFILLTVGGLLSGTVGALGYGYFFNKFFQVNPGTKQHLAWGFALANGWSELSDREQEKLNKLLKNHAP